MLRLCQTSGWTYGGQELPALGGHRPASSWTRRARWASVPPDALASAPPGVAGSLWAVPSAPPG
eukprot:6025310-Heterocapsa_arctica.AAC.1